MLIIGKTLEELNLAEGEVIDTEEFITKIIQGGHLEYDTVSLYELCAIYPELFDNPSFKTLLNESAIKSYTPNVTKFIEEHLSLVYCSESPNIIRLKLDDAFIEIECILSQQPNRIRAYPNTPVCEVLAKGVFPLEGLDTVLQPRIVKLPFDLKQLSKIMTRKRSWN